MNVKDTDKGFKALLKRMLKARSVLSVGVHTTDGSADAGGTPLIVVAAAHEFGTNTIPRRSFVADWADENDARHKAQMKAIAKAVIVNEVPSEQKGLERLGNVFVGEVQKRIASGLSPPLQQTTIKRKGSSKPLIDTGQLRSSIAYAIDGKLGADVKRPPVSGKKAEPEKRPKKKPKPKKAKKK